MKVIWEKGPLPAHEIIESLGPGWHPKTARTLLSRLVKKGAVGLRKAQRPYSYRALVTEVEQGS